MNSHERHQTKLLKLYEEMVTPERKIPKRENVCESCQYDLVLYNEGWVCEQCGAVDHTVFVSDSAYVEKKCLYMRRLYFIERMNLLCGVKQSGSKEYTAMIKNLREHLKENKIKLKSVQQLRALLKRLKYNKFYKHVYNIWFDLTKKRLIQMDSQEIHRLAREFVEMESMFKSNRDKHQRKNIFSYSVLIYLLLKKHKIKGYSQLLLPYEHKKLTKLIAENCFEA